MVATLEAPSIPAQFIMHSTQSTLSIGVTGGLLVKMVLSPILIMVEIPGLSSRAAQIMTSTQSTLLTQTMDGLLVKMAP